VRGLDRTARKPLQLCIDLDQPRRGDRQHVLDQRTIRANGALIGSLRMLPNKLF
jgi:hypothetical protein